MNMMGLDWSRFWIIFGTNDILLDGKLFSGASVIFSRSKLIINPRRACAARVTVLCLFVCLSVCLSVCQLQHSRPQ